MTTTANRPRIGIGTADITEEDRARVMHALVTGRLSAGPFMAEFESRFAAMHERKHAAMCNTGTGALQLALQTLRERHGRPAGRHDLDHGDRRATRAAGDRGLGRSHRRAAPRTDGRLLRRLRLLLDLHGAPGDDRRQGRGGQPCYRGRLEFAPGTFPYAERALANGFYIGSRQGMNDDGIATIAGIVRPILEEASP